MQVAFEARARNVDVRGRKGEKEQTKRLGNH
jgi:hypothetical protein